MAFLKPTGKKMLIFVLLIVFGVLDWYNILNPCGTPLYSLDCPIYSFRYQKEVIPGLFPPMFFKEGCKSDYSIHMNVLGWECTPYVSSYIKTWSRCAASCEVHPASWIYTMIYWYFLSSLIFALSQKLNKGSFKKSRMFMFVKPTRGKTLCLLIFIVLGVIDLFDLPNMLQSPPTNIDCTLSPCFFRPRLTPGLYPPMMFEEGCRNYDEITMNFFAWECEPIMENIYGPWDICVANCNIYDFAWVYTFAYWYLLSCLMVFFYDKATRKKL